ANDDVGGVDVEVGELVAAVHRLLDAELGDGVAGAPAHRHAFDHVGPRRDDSHVGRAVLQQRARHHGSGGVPGAEEHDLQRLGDRYASKPVTVWWTIRAVVSTTSSRVIPRASRSPWKAAMRSSSATSAAAAAIGEISVLTRPSACDSVTVVAR